MWWNSTWCMSCCKCASRIVHLQKCTERVLVNGKKRSLAEFWAGMGDQTRSECSLSWKQDSLLQIWWISQQIVTEYSIFPSLCHWEIRTHVYRGYRWYTELCKSLCFSSFVAFWPLTTCSGQKNTEKGIYKKKKKANEKEQFLSSLPWNNRKSCSKATPLCSQHRVTTIQQHTAGNNPDSRQSQQEQVKLVLRKLP